jgi:hypothetical protein
MISYFLFFIIILIFIIGFKYHIDTNMTIQEIKKDRDRYRKMFSNKIEQDGEQKTSMNKFEKMYKELKTNLDKIIVDLKDTDFETYPNIKEEFISALIDIESYGNPNDKG